MARTLDIDKALDILKETENDAHMRVDEYSDDNDYELGYWNGIRDCIFDLDEADWEDKEPVIRCAECGWATKTTYPVSSFQTAVAYKCPFMKGLQNEDNFCSKGIKHHES